MKSYRAVVTREDAQWLANVPELEGAHTFASSIAGLRKALREVVVLTDDLADDTDPLIELEFDVSDPAVAEAVGLRDKRARLAAFEAEVLEETSRAVRALTRSGYTVRDVSQLVGVTPGRVSQLAPRERAE